MVDVFTKSKRSTIMRSIRSKDTKPEMVVRRLTHSLGYRYRLHVQSLPGCPDLVFPSRRKVIFVHGCFWHRHNCRKGKSTPKTRKLFWKEKLEQNKERDRKLRRKIHKDGWELLVIWECQTKNQDRLASRISCFLEE